MTVQSADIDGVLAITIDETQPTTNSVLVSTGTLDISGATIDVTIVGATSQRRYTIATAGTLLGSFATVNSVGGYDVKQVGNTIVLSKDLTVIMFR